MRVGEVMLGCALAVAKKQRDGLIDLMNLGYSVITDAFQLGVQQNGTEDEGVRKTILFVAMTWVRVMSTHGGKLTEEEEIALAMKLDRCLFHARDRANVILEPMAKSVTEFDLESVGQLNFFEKDLSLFERALQNREKFEFLYPGFEPPNAQLQVEAKVKEDGLAQSLSEKHEAAVVAMVGGLSETDDAGEKESQFEAIKEWYFACDDTLVELRCISGKRCKIAIGVVASRKEEMVELLKPILVHILGPGAEPDAIFKGFQEACDSHSQTLRTKIFLQIKHLPDGELMSHLFTLSLDDFAGLKDVGISKSSLVTFIESIGGLSSMTPEQQIYVNERLALA
jgi:hypothetical protein